MTPDDAQYGRAGGIMTQWHQMTPDYTRWQWHQMMHNMVVQETSWHIVSLSPDDASWHSDTRWCVMTVTPDDVVTQGDARWGAVRSCRTCYVTISQSCLLTCNRVFVLNDTCHIQLTCLQHGTVLFSWATDSCRQTHRQTYDNTVYLLTACHAELHLGQRQNSSTPVQTSSIQSSSNQLNPVQFSSDLFKPVLPSQVQLKPV